jgi:hypothetical protein
MPDFIIEDVPPDLKPLFRALTECGKPVFMQTLKRLIEPPASLQMPAASQSKLANSLLKELVPFDGDMAARMLQLDDGQPDSEAKWRDLSRAQRKRARRLWDWALDAGLNTTPQGRPHKIDAALVLYCARVIAEGCRKSRFKFSRPPEGGPPGGPMWRALMEALPLALGSLGRVDGALPSAPQRIGNRAEAVADILIIARSKEFRARCQELGIGTSAGDVAEHPATFRLALTRARALRNRSRRK